MELGTALSLRTSIQELITHMSFILIMSFQSNCDIEFSLEEFEFLGHRPNYLNLTLM